MGAGRRCNMLILLVQYGDTEMWGCPFTAFIYRCHSVHLSYMQRTSIVHRAYIDNKIRRLSYILVVLYMYVIIYDPIRMLFGSLCIIYRLLYVIRCYIWYIIALLGVIYRMLDVLLWLNDVREIIRENGCLE